MLSIICPYNDKKILKNALENSIQRQIDTEYELLTIDANEHGFTSAAETLNYIGKNANGDFLIFIHQDVIFEANNILKQVDTFCRKNKFGIAGVAGCKKINGKSKTITQIHQGMDHKNISSLKKYNNPIEVDSLDECMLIIPKQIFNKYKFSDIGRTWHLYGTDYSLNMLQHNYKVLLLPIDIWHLSDGASLNENYFDAMIKLAKIYRNDVSEIVTIYGIWPTKMIKLYCKCLYRKIRLRIRGH
ncbi:MAG: glycosyltransferase [Roseburia faecis]|nr:glycosyltransferase [Roseburia faecis]